MDYNTEQSPKIANYSIDVYLDHIAKTADCSQALTWKNSSPDTIRSLRFYMYMNAFKNMKSSYLRDSKGKVFGQDISNRSEEEWGNITITKIKDASGNDLTDLQQYIHLDDDNENDQSVLEITLAEWILP